MKGAVSRAIALPLFAMALAIILTGARGGETSEVAYRTGPPAGHTGGFGEPHCTACHADAPVDEAPGTLELDVPEHYTPGAIHTLRITLTDPALSAAGFQLAVRFASGPTEGQQAGRVGALDGDTRVVDMGGIAYVVQTFEGSSPDGDGAATWQVAWAAPDAGEVVFHVAANAANADASEFGDRIHTARALSRPGEAK